MTKKQMEALKKIMASLPDDSRASYQEIAKYAISLGYMPSLKGARKDYVDFTKSKVKRTIMKINTDPKFPPSLAMKFYAVPSYPEIFQKAVDDRLTAWNKYKYEARCFGCGKCDGTEGYTVPLPEGKQGFLCGFGLLPLPQIKTEHVQEINEALKTQDEFFMSQIK